MLQFFESQNISWLAYSFMVLPIDIIDTHFAYTGK